MQSFKAATPTNPDMFCHSSFFLRGDDCNSRNQARFSDLGELDHPAAAFHHDDAVDLSPSSIFSLNSSNVGVVATGLHYGALNTSIGATEIVSTGTGCLDTGQFMYQKGTTFGASLGNGHIENWGDSGLADNSQQTDTSTDVDTDDKNQLGGVQHGAIITVDSVDQSKTKTGDQKILRRLAQNREAARKSRLRKKAYVQQLENSRLRLTQLEQELQKARQQGMFIASGLSAEHGHSVGNGALAFDVDYARWLDEHQRLINDLRSAVNSHMGDNELRIVVDAVMAHYDEIYRLKSIATKADVFHMLSDYMGQMAIAMGKLATLENFLHQADLLRQQTLQQLHRILTTRQAARALLVINDYTSRLRALSSLWLARPRN
ncbi:hypothetical protein COLO4_07887 [Corchorus olitorius]|uniref:BZIP domain-containing protein n=1 Tax=Corchorus olitorius TaxID=93759 RepID=A0A1R3KIA3_9ROSI|nr:hypothetical protein COLO4_07887 [Corchorus olitorius]